VVSVERIEDTIILFTLLHPIIAYYGEETWPFRKRKNRYLLLWKEKMLWIIIDQVKYEEIYV